MAETNSLDEYLNTQSFKKREGTTDKGPVYQDLTIASLALNLTCDDSVDSFTIKSNRENLDHFNHVIFTVDNTEKNTTQKKHTKYAVQTKHLEKKNKKVKLTFLRNDAKIFEGYKSLDKLQGHKLIFASNLVLKDDLENTSVSVKVGDAQLDVKLRTDEPDEIISSIHPKCRCYKFTCANNCLAPFHEYLENLFLYTELEDVEHCEEDIHNNLFNQFGCTKEASEGYIDYVRKWSAQQKKKELTKTIMPYVLTLRLLSPYIKGLSFHENTNCLYRILGDIMLKCNVTVVDASKADKVKSLWAHLQKPEEQILEQVNTILQLSVNIKDGEVLSKLLWCYGTCPLIVQDNDVIRRTIKLCKDRKFVLLTPNSIALPVPCFARLSDLEPETSNEFVQNITVDVQGKSKDLKSFLEVNAELSSIITTGVMFDMCDSMKIGGGPEILPSAYVTRSLTRTIIKYEFFTKRFANTLLVIDSVLDVESFREKHQQLTIIDCDELLSNGICVKRGQMTSRDLGSRKYHHFRFICDIDGVEWIASTADVAHMDDHRLEGCFLTESQFFRDEDHSIINLICADPGMGKTTLMKSLKNNSSTLWTVFVYARNCSTHFENNGASVSKFMEYILEETRERCGAFDAKVVEVLMKKGCVSYIWDGLDEVTYPNLHVALTIIGQLRTNGSKHWITARNNLKQDLEKKFNVVARDLKPFDEADQKLYIEDRIKHSDGYNKHTVGIIINYVKSLRYGDFLGTPLYIFILTELFKQDLVKYQQLLQENKLSITDLYERFVEERFNCYKKEKSDASNDVMNKIIDRFKKYSVAHYKMEAMKLYFEPKTLESLDINCEEWENDIRQDGDLVGLIVGFNDDFQFLHNSFGEYFAATYLINNQRKISHFKEVIFEDKYRNVRNLFDLMLARDCPAHIAVLNNNLQELKKCTRPQLLAKDAGGRTPLHLAASWGTKCVVLNTKKIDNKHVIDDKSVDKFEKDQASIFVEIIEFLLGTCDPSDVDDLFGLNCFAYAYRSHCLLSLAIMATVQNIKPNEFKTNLSTILYYCVTYDYSQIFNVIEEIPDIEVEHFGSLMYLAVWSQSINCLRKMLEKQRQKKLLKENNDPFLHTACEKKNYGIARLLLDNGVDVNKEDEKGKTAKTYATEKSIIDLLNSFGSPIEENLCP